MAVCVPFISDPLNPKGVLALATRTANQGSITNVRVDLTGLQVTFIATAGRRYRIYTEMSFQSTVANDSITIEIRDSSGATQFQARTVVPSTANVAVFAAATVFVTPVSGSQTFKIQALRQSGTGTLTMTASATNPAYLIAEDVGPS